MSVGLMRRGWPSWGDTMRAPPAISARPSPSSRTWPVGAVRRNCTALRRAAALRAELGSLELRPAVGAELLGGCRRGSQRDATAGAELAAARLLPARRAQRSALVAVVDVARPVLGLDLLVELVDLGAGLHGRHFLIELGRARDAQAPLLVEADLAAHPLPAAVALDEVLRAPGPRLGQRLIPGGA